MEGRHPTVIVQETEEAVLRAKLDATQCFGGLIQRNPSCLNENIFEQDRGPDGSTDEDDDSEILHCAHLINEYGRLLCHKL